MSIHPSTRCLFFLIIFCVALLSPKLLHAAVSDCKGTGTPALGTTAALSGLKIPRDLPIGAAIPGGRLSITQSATCPSTTISGTKAGWVLFTSSTTTPVAGLTNVYTVAGMPSGIGFRILDASGVALSIGRIDNNAYYSALIGGAPKGQTSFSWNGVIELVKIGDLPAVGSYTLKFATAVHFEAWLNGSEGASSISISYSIENSALTTCTVINPSQTVTLPTVSVGTVNNRDRSPSGQTPFTISLRCSRGAELHMTMTDANNPANTSQILGAAGVTGVPQYGLAIRYRDPVTGDALSWVSFGPDSSAAGAPGQFKIGVATDGVMGLNFYAAYSRLNGGATPFPIGQFGAKATFTLSYQ